MEMSFTLLAASGIFYAAAFLSHLLSFFSAHGKGHRPGFALMRVGFLFGTIAFISEAIDRGAFLPVVNLPQALAFFAWSLAFVYLVFLVRIQTGSFGLILTPILVVLVGLSLAASALHPETPEPAWTMLSPYFKIHIISAFFAYASFTLSFAAGLLYLIQHRELKSKSAGTFYHKLPSLEELEGLIYQPLIWGLPLLATAVIVGFLWSKSTYGEYWIWDPKTLATLATTGLYLVILYLRYVSSIRGKQVAMMSMIAFAFVVCSFIGMRFIEGSHNYLQ